MRYDPLCEKIMVAKGTVLGGFGYTTTGCSEGVYFEVADKYEYSVHLEGRL